MSVITIAEHMDGLMLKAEILAVGDELCYGRVYDVNSFWIADQLTRLGVLVQRITCVRDDEEDDALKSSLPRGSNYVFITGGLGPTEDDRTLAALSKFTGKRVVVSEAILRVLSERRKIPYSAFQPHHLKMASTLEGAECLPNPVGWAPVTILNVNHCTVCVLPGPPNEAQACFNEHIVGRIRATTKQRSLARRVKVNMYESEVTPILKKLSTEIKGLYAKPLVSEGSRERGLPIEIITFGDTEALCKEKYDMVFHKLKELIESRGREIIEA
ncbi:MAG: competence/damage-inducible protein A [Candidatus Bathyarchaeia archaeon]